MCSSRGTARPGQSLQELLSAVSEQAGRWFVSIQVEEEQEEPNPTTTTAIGIDLGIKTLATLSDGMTFDNPRPFKHASARLRRLERQKSRRKKGGQIKRQLLYTSKREGTFLVMIDRFYPSSKTCSSCGTVRSELGLDERVFVCLDCGYVADRDYNAAKNSVQQPVGFASSWAVALDI